MENLHSQRHRPPRTRPGSRQNQFPDEIGIETFKWPRTAMHDGYVRAGAGRNMREFKGDVAAAYKDNVRWQSIEFQELRAGGQVLFAGYVQTGVPGPASDHDRFCGNRLIRDPQRSTLHKVRPTMESSDARLGQTPLVLLRHPR